MKRNSIRISVLLLPLLLVGMLAAQLGWAGDLLFIGGTAADVVSPVTGATIEEWVLNGADVESAKVSFGRDLDPGSRVCVQVTGGTSPLANGCHFVDAGGWDMTTDPPITVSFSTGALDSTAPAADVTSVDVTVVGPIPPYISGGFPIEISAIRWVLLDTDTSKVGRVEIDFAPYGGNLNSCGKDDTCDFEVLFALQNSDGITLAQHQEEVVLAEPDENGEIQNTGDTVVWDPVVSLLTGETGVSAEAITRFVIGVKPGDPWDMMASIPDKLGHGAGMTTDGTHIYLMIGSRNRVYRFDPAANGGPSDPFWTELPRTPNNPNQGGALAYATLNGTEYLYAFRGGTQDFWRLDLSDVDGQGIPKGPWISMANAPGDVKWGGSLAWDDDEGGYIYAFRGGDRSDFWRYDISDGPLGSWDTTLEPAPGDVRDGGALVYVEDDNGRSVYAMRGGSTTDFWRFDIDVNGGQWALDLGDNPPAPIDQPVGRGGALASDGLGLIYALRGNDTKEIYRYVIDQDTWAIGPDIPLPMREGGSLVVLNGDVYATQGRQQNEFLRISPLPPFLDP